MSKVVDERVVEMRFDNSQFEKNVSTSMSTLEKFKQKLNFRGVSKGFEEVGAAAQKVDMRGLGAGVDSVSAKFSALQIMGTTALVNITNSAVNAGKRMVKALTLDPVMSGFQEYETQMNAVQTILANTQSKGSTLDDVNKALDELNHYADLTIYNFTEMTRNIGTFTAAGIDLETSVSAIQGIANLAAVSGSTSQQASVAMYQLSQALAAGTVKLMDWNSVVNAGMGGEIFQNALKKTSELLGTGAEASIKAEGSFRESLKSGWLTSQVLTETLKKFTTSGANEYVAEYTGLSVDAVQAALDAAKAQHGEADAIEYAAKALAEKSGKNADEIQQALQMARTAEDAATKVKTFSQLWDVMKEAAQSGWARTWQLIVGDFEEAKNLLTPLSDFFTNVIGKISDARNDLLEGALGMGFKSLAKKFDTIMAPAKKAAETIDKVKDSVTDLNDIVNQVIRGNFGNGKERIDKLTSAGVNYYRVQNKVNEALNNSYRHSDEKIAAQDKLLGIQEKTSDAAAEASEETAKLTDEQKNFIKELASMTEEQAKAKGYTDEQIAALKELADTAEKLGIPIEDLIDNLDEINGRWLLINSFKNIGQGLLTIIKSIGAAWRDIFPAVQAEQLFNLIAGFHKLTTRMKVSDETADKLRRTFRGLFAALDIILTVVSGPLKIGFKILQQLLGAFDLTIFDVTAKIGDVIVKFRDWIDSVFDMSGVFEKISPYITKFIDKVKELFKTVKNWKLIDKLVASFKKLVNVLKKLVKFDMSDISFGDVVARVKEVFASLPKEMRKIGGNIIEGLQNGLGDKISAIFDKAKQIATTIINTIKDLLGIHSPSTVMFEIGENVVSGLINGIGSGIQLVINSVAAIGKYIINAFKKLDFSPIVNTLKSGFNKMKEAAGGFDWKKLLAIIPIGVVLVVVKQMYDFVSALSDGVGSINKVIDGLADVEKSFSKVLNAKAFETAAEGLEKVAKAIAILAAAVVVLSYVDETNLYRSVGVIVVLSLVLTALSKAVSKMQAASAKIGKDGLKIAGLKTGLLTIGMALLALALVAKMMSGLSPDEMDRAFIGLAGVIGALVVVFGALQLLALIPSKNIMLIGPMLLKIVFAIGLMALVCKLIGKLSPDEAMKGISFALVFLMFLKYLVEFTTIGNDKHIAKLSGLLFAISFSVMLMVGACKLIGTLKSDEAMKGVSFLLVFLMFVKYLVEFTKIGNDSQIAKLSGLLLSISISIMLMVGACKLIGALSVGDAVKGAIFVGVFLIFIKLLIKVTTIGNDVQIAKVAATLLAMSVAIGILAGVVILLSMMPDPSALANAAQVVVMLGIVVAIMIAATNGAEKCVGNIVALAIAVGIMAGAVAVLSTIDREKLFAAAGSLGVLMLVFALILKIAGGMGNVTLTLLAMSVAIGILGGVLYLVGQLPAESSIGAAVALSIAMLAFAATMRIISGMKGPSASALGAIAVMALVVAALGGILYLLKDVDPLHGIETVGVIIAFLAVLWIAIKAMQIIQAPSKSALIALGIITLVVAALAGVLYLMQDVDPLHALEIAGVITVFLLAMEGVCLVAALIGKLAGPAVTGLAILVGFIAVLGLVVLGLAALAMEVISGMPQLGADLSAFMTNVQPFIEGVQNIPDDMSDKISTLCKAILKLAGTEIIDAIADFLSGGSSLADMGKELQTFGEGMASFSASMSNVDSAIASLSKIKELKNAIPDVDLSPLDDIADTLKSYSDKVSSLNTLAIATSITMARHVVAFISSLGSSDLTGISSFNIQPLGTKLAMYSLSVSTINSGAVLASIVMARHLRDFITSLSSMDTSGVAGYQDAVTKLGTISVTSIVESFKAGSGSVRAAAAELFTAALTGMKSTQGTIVGYVKETVRAIQTTFMSGKTSLMSVGRELMSALVSGMTAGKANLESTVKLICDSAVSSIRYKHGSFYDAGWYLAEGFADGIEGSAFQAKTAAIAMAQAALEAAEEALGIASPSKEAGKVGEFFGEGFINGIMDCADASAIAGSDLGESAKEGLEKYITDSIQNMGLSNLDLQPTIRPVFDMDDLRANVDEAEKLLSNGSFSVTEKVTGNIDEKLKELQSIVDKVWRGDYGNGSARVSALTNAGYDYKTIQDLVNKTVDGRRLTLDDLPTNLTKNISQISSIESNVSSIIPMVKDKLQNGNSKTDEIVSGLAKQLKTSMSEAMKNNPTIVIDGVQVTSDSELGNTLMKALTRAAKIERRV